MAIPKKGSRVLVVDSNRYRWAATSRRGYDLTIVIELAESPKQRIVVRFHMGAVATPGFVERMIRAALDQSWDPETKGRQIDFIFTGDVEEFNLVRIEEWLARSKSGKGDNSTSEQAVDLNT